ncbi:MAG TPA: hypothetical protein PLA85_08075 [Micropepsaceae bacterium]|nr:hypothetical protein [Micropepsaceae bacterium]
MLAQQPEKNVPEPGTSYRASETRVRPLRVIAREIRNADWLGIGILLVVALVVTGAFFGVSALGDAPRKLERLILLAAAFWTSILTAAWASGRSIFTREIALVVAGASVGLTFWYLVVLYQIGVSFHEQMLLAGLGALAIAWAGKGKIAAALAILWMTLAWAFAMNPYARLSDAIAEPMIITVLLLVVIAFAATKSFGGRPVLIAAFVLLSVFLFRLSWALNVIFYSPSTVVLVRQKDFDFGRGLHDFWQLMDMDVVVMPAIVAIWALVALFSAPGILRRFTRAWLALMLTKCLVDRIGVFQFQNSAYEGESATVLLSGIGFALSSLLLLPALRRLSADEIFIALLSLLAINSALFFDEYSADHVRVAMALVIAGWALLKGWWEGDLILLAVAGGLIGTWLVTGIYEIGWSSTLRPYRDIVGQVVSMAIPLLAALLPLMRWTAQRRRELTHG